MKKILIAAMAVVAFASCSKTTPDLPVDGTPRVEMTLQGDGQSRAFFGNAATAETWESEITTLCVYVFNPSGNLIVRRTMSAAEVAARSATFSLPRSAAGTSCSFYVVANADYGNVTTASAMEQLKESATLGDYNGTFAQTAQGRKRSAGFVMTGKSTATIVASGSSTTVGVTLKRTVAKIAVRASVDAAFTTSYNGGTLTILSARLSKASALSNSFFRSGSFQPRTSLYDWTQTPSTNGNYKELMFYAYENSTLAEGSRVTLTITGTFDADGNAATTADRSDVDYEIELTGAGSGELKRNGYYRVEALIKGLSGDGLTVSFSVADWETPVTQSVNLGS